MKNETNDTVVTDTEPLEQRSLENPLQQQTLPEGPLKQMIVNYVGGKLAPENDSVTLEMIINVVAEEFPDILLSIAEENFMRGYQQALQDTKYMGADAQSEPSESLPSSPNVLEPEIVDE